MTNLERSRFTKVAAMMHNGTWQWPKQRNRCIQQIIAHTPAYSVPNVQISDKVVWLPASNGLYDLQSEG